MIMLVILKSRNTLVKFSSTSKKLDFDSPLTAGGCPSYKTFVRGRLYARTGKKINQNVFLSICLMKVVPYLRNSLTNSPYFSILLIHVTTPVTVHLNLFTPKDEMKLFLAKPVHF